MTSNLGKLALAALLAVGLTGCSALSEAKTTLLRPSEAPVPISTSFLGPTFAPSSYDLAAVVAEMCVGAIAAPAAIQAIIDAKDGCASMTDRPYGGNPRALFQHVDAGGAGALEWLPGQLVQFTGELGGVYEVVNDDWVAFGDTQNFPDLNTDLLFQTCSWDADGGSDRMRAVGLNRVA